MLAYQEYAIKPRPEDIVEECKNKGRKVLSLTYFPLLNNNWFVFVFYKISQ